MSSRFASIQAAFEMPTTAVEQTPENRSSAAPAQPEKQKQDQIVEAKIKVHRQLLEDINLSAVEALPKEQMVGELRQFINEYVVAERLALNTEEFEAFVEDIVDEMIGLGPLEALLKDPGISDILINGHENCFVERGGMLQPIKVPFKAPTQMKSQKVTDPRYTTSASTAVARAFSTPATIMMERLRSRSAITPPSSENTTDGIRKDSMTQVSAMAEPVMS